MRTRRREDVITSSRAKVRCAVIGAGWWGTTAHLPALRSHPRARIVAIQHHRPEIARQIAKDFGAERSCASWEEVLAIESLDAVVLSSPPHLHYPQASAALRRGLHVLIEKPMTIQADHAHELVRIADDRGLHFLISSPWHYTAHMLEARRLIRAGSLGQIQMISVLSTNFSAGLYRGQEWSEFFRRRGTVDNAAEPYLPPEPTTYSDPAVSGGGQIYCQVSHVGAYLAFLTGHQPRAVFARFDSADASVDVHDVICAKWESGILISIASTGGTMLTERHHELRIYGTRGMLVMELWKGAMSFHDSDQNVTRYPDLSPEAAYPHLAPAQNFVDVILGRAENGSPAWLGASAVSLICAACESERTGRDVSLVHT